MLKKFKIKKRLTVAFIVVAIIASISGIVGCVAMSYIASEYDYALLNYGFSQGDIGKAMTAFSDAQGSTRAVIGYTNAEVIAEQMAIHDERKADCQEQMEKVKGTLTADAEKSAYESAETAMAQYWEKDLEILEIGNTTDVAESKRAQDIEAEELLPIYNEVNTHLEELMSLNVSTGNELQSSLATLRVTLFVVIIIVIIIALLASVLLGSNIAKGIANPLSKLSGRLQTFAQGELSAAFPESDSQDEVSDMIVIARNMADNLIAIIGDAKERLKEMAKGNYTMDSRIPERYVGEFSELHTSIHEVNEKMNETLHQIEEAASQVTAGSINMAEGAQSLAEGATEQAGAIEELLATFTDLTGGLGRTADEQQGAYKLSRQYADKANESKTEMQGMVTTMGHISETSQKIGGIISDIEEIASQTNLLSLNASIEAARAGEAGKGFAVVADQIGKLAEESAQSAVHTRELILNALSEIETGTQTAEQTAKVIDEVVDGVNQIADTVRECSEQSKVQVESMKEAEQGVNQISDVVQANSATAEESSATSEELSAQAETLKELVSQFELR